MINMFLYFIVVKVVFVLLEVMCSQFFGEGCDVYKVMDKMFLFNLFLSGVVLSNLKVMFDYGVMLCDIYFYMYVGWYMNKKYWILIYEDENVDLDLVIDLVYSFYEFVVFKLNKL